MFNLRSNKTKIILSTLITAFSLTSIQFNTIGTTSNPSNSTKVYGQNKISNSNGYKSTSNTSNASYSNSSNTSISKGGIDDNTTFTWENASIYYLMTDRFFNGDPSNDESYGRKKIDAKGKNVGTYHGGDFKGITKKLEEGYFKDLGITAIWISAPYEGIHGFIPGGKNGEFAHYGFHGYYPLDYTSFDKNFGTYEDFKKLVDTAHSQDIRIILDVVMNHVGYSTIADMKEFSFGSLKGIDGSWQPSQNETFKDYEKYVDYNDEMAWESWWGKDFIRASISGYDKGGSDDLTLSLAGLPDVKTESNKKIPIPKILKTKWSMVSEEDKAYELKGVKELRKDSNLTPREYIEKWLVAYVYEFGIDGFRIDTAKHVDLSAWKSLKEKSDEALKKWRQENPNKSGANFKDDFFMMGEVWGQGINKNNYHDNGFDALINFTFQGEGTEGPAYNKATMKNIFTKYSEVINKENINFVSYISSHDTKLFPRNKIEDGITYLSLLPGAIEIFYGDESKRPYGESLGDITQGTRSFMNWETLDEKVLNHAKIMFKFRRDNIEIGSGINTILNEKPLVFKRELMEKKAKSIIIIDGKKGLEVNLNGEYNEGIKLHDYYSNKDYVVKEGKIILDNDYKVILLKEVKS